MIPRLKTIFRNERGNVLVVAAAGCFALVGGAGLATDTTQWFLAKRQLQMAADAGALAGAHSLAHRVDVEAPARREIGRNSDTNVVVGAINDPPEDGDFTGDPTAVEVVLTTQTRLAFAGLFLERAPVIRARSVAARVRKSESCVIALAEDGTGVHLTGGAQVSLGCGVAANSSGGHSIHVEGSSTISSPALAAVGGVVAKDSAIGPGTELMPFGTPQDDPLGAGGRNLEVPSSPSSCTATNYTAEPNKPQVTLSPGRYCGGMTLKGNVRLGPGVYIVDGGSFYLSSQAQVSGEGVTIILTGDTSEQVATVKVDGGATADLTAPTAAQDPYWKDILFFQDPKAEGADSYFAGGGNMKMEGIVYLPGGDISFTGGSSATTDCLLLVANRVTFTGNTSLANSCDADLDSEFALRVVRVVE